MAQKNELNEPLKKFKSDSLPLSPYDRAKAEWDNRIGSAVVQAFSWRLFALAAVVVCIVLAVGLIIQSTKSSVVPYVIELSPDGQATTLGVATQGNFRAGDREVKFFLSEFIRQTRTLSVDPAVVKDNWLRAFKFLSPAATIKMNDYTAKDNPMNGIGKITRQADVTVILPQTKDTYQVRWSERTYSTEGIFQNEIKMTGNFSVEIIPPKTEENLYFNPLGIYIKDFSWAKEIK